MKTVQWKRWTVIVFAVYSGASTLHAQLTFTNGLKLWLKADAGVTTNTSGLVSTWADQTTNGFDVGQAGADSLKPLWVANQMGGRPVLRFDGANDYLNNTVDNVVTGGQARTVFIVAKQDPTDLSGTLFTFRRSTAGGTRIMALMQADLFAGNTYIYSDGVAINNWSTANQNAVVVKPFQATYRWAGVGNFMQEWMNGQSLAVSGNGTATAQTGLTGFTVGGREDFPTTAGWKGDVAEILVYDNALAATDRQNVYEYLVATYALPEPSAMALLAVGGLLLWRRR